MKSSTEMFYLCLGSSAFFLLRRAWHKRMLQILDGGPGKVFFAYVVTGKRNRGTNESISCEKLSA